MRRKFFILLPFLCALAAAAKPNILLIIADDYGVDSSSLYNSTNTGATLPPTPNIASLVTNGVLFRNAYANPVCSPTRACVLTGQFGYRTGVGDVVDFGPGLTTNAFTLPKAFTNAAAGYALTQFGKWHLATGNTSPRNIGGWTNFAGSIQGAVANYTNWTKVVNGTPTPNYTNYATTDLVNDATNWIAARGTNAWFVWAAFNAPHTPYHIPPANLCPSYPANTLTNNLRQFGAMVEALDTEIGRLLNAIDRTNTHIIFLGDNGTLGGVNGTLQPPYPSSRGKDTLYEGGTHVPLIISGPAVIAPRRTNDTPVNMADLFATILELAGTSVAAAVPANVPIDGQSLLPALQATNVLTHYAYAEEFGTNVPVAAGGHALRGARYKLIQFLDAREEFYDLASDPYESVNLLTNNLTATAQSNYYSLKLRLAGYTALAQPVITGVGKTNLQFSATVTRATNLTYTLWRAPLLDDLAWTPQANARAVTNNPTSVTLTDTNAAGAAAFYRVVGAP